MLALVAAQLVLILRNALDSASLGLSERPLTLLLSCPSPTTRPKGKAQCPICHSVYLWTAIPWQTHRTEDCLLQITLTSLSHSAGSSPAFTFQRGLIFSLALLSRHRVTLPLHILPLSHEYYLILFRNLSAVQNLPVTHLVPVSLLPVF